MSEVLVLVDIADGAPRKVNAELLALAARIGAPAAVVVGAPGTAESVREQLAGWGAETVYAAESEAATAYLVTPQVAALTAVARRRRDHRARQPFLTLIAQRGRAGISTTSVPACMMQCDKTTLRSVRRCVAPRAANEVGRVSIIELR